MNLIWVAAALGLAFAARSVAAEPAVRAWQGSMSLPTWEQGLADPIPHFPVLGADHAWYPYASRAEPGKESRNQTWRTLNLENEFLVCVVLPDLGGRLYSCRDKLSGYDMFYANPAAKKAVLGVELNFPVLNFPMHNGPCTMSPVDFQTVQNADSASVWVGGTDRITGMRWRVEFALERGWAALRQSVRVDNPTAVRHGYAWWTNATVKLDDDTRVIDGLPGVYHPRAQTGTLHYADAAEMPDRNIVRATDNVALGAGVHGLLDPAASSTFTEYWIPVRKMAGISQAGRDGVLFLARENGALKAQLLSTRSIAGAKVRILCGARTLAEESIAFDAAKPWERTIAGAPDGPCKLQLQDAAGHALIEGAEGEAKSPAPPAIPALDSAGQFEL
ncbi:MAG: hypothetical protein JWP63_5461, partial [Candidatus Solibacter sp.]|nr:hypothetical protein [Candidatus Solibacter sp.]